MWWLPLEGAGFEPSVPPISSVVTHGTPARHPRPHFTAGMMMRGTEGSNPPPSSGEMVWGRRRGNGAIVAASN